MDFIAVFEDLRNFIDEFLHSRIQTDFHRSLEYSIDCSACHAVHCLCPSTAWQVSRLEEGRNRLENLGNYSGYLTGLAPRSQGYSLPFSAILVVCRLDPQQQGVCSGRQKGARH